MSFRTGWLGTEGGGDFFAGPAVHGLDHLPVRPEDAVMAAAQDAFQLSNDLERARDRYEDRLQEKRVQAARDRCEQVMDMVRMGILQARSTPETLAYMSRCADLDDERQERELAKLAAEAPDRLERMEYVAADAWAEKFHLQQKLKREMEPRRAEAWERYAVRMQYGW